jgi:uncharacterized protein (DUF927 family)
MVIEEQIKKVTNEEAIEYEKMLSEMVYCNHPLWIESNEGKAKSFWKTLNNNKAKAKLLVDCLTPSQWHTIPKNHAWFVSKAWTKEVQKEMQKNAIFNGKRTVNDFNFIKKSKFFNSISENRKSGERLNRNFTSKILDKIDNNLIRVAKRIANSDLKDNRTFITNCFKEEGLYFEDEVFQ